MALRPPGNPQSLLRRALSAINNIVHPARDNLLTPGSPSLVLPPSSSTSTFSGISPVLPAPDHSGDRGTFRRGFASHGGSIKATLFPGDGIGPEIAESVKQIFDAVQVQVEWDIHFVGKTVDPKTGSFITWDSMESVRQCGIGLKGPMATPIGKGHKSLNLTLRKELGLYANVRPCLSIPGYKTRYDNVDLVTIRENTEGEYSGLEHQVVKGVVESLKIITRTASKRVAEYAFHYAKLHGRKRVSAIHKANIMKKTDGLFLQCCREVAEKYPDLVYEEVIIDNCCMMVHLKH
ncbi:hypothetical protein M758_10G121200 [Ceratodon purpureus]|nr:hypothetical protein M758_10G121200 [Ceratodon purpureus]